MPSGHPGGEAGQDSVSTLILLYYLTAWVPHFHTNSFLRNCGEKPSTENRLQLARELLSSARGHGQGISTAFGNVEVKIWGWDNKQHCRPSAPRCVFVSRARFPS